ncbi:MAG: hypothetical protein VX747_03330, partial [Actinomycetota bacterium]|nr:hypothetical protein [Actinomycetota bacterium]
MIDAWPWWLGGLVLVATLGWVAWQRRDRLGASALVVGVLAAALLVPPSEEAPGLPGPLAAIAQGAPCEVGAMAWQEGTLRLPATCGGAATEVVVGPATGDRRIAQTRRHSVMNRDGAGGAETQALTSA